MAITTIFELEKVSFRYAGGTIGLREISLSVAAGERLVLLGPNGSGKSTLQKIMAALVFPETGQLSAFGQQITPAVMRDKQFAAAYRRKVGYVFQNSEVQLFCMTVLDELMFGPLAMGMSHQEAKGRAEELIEWFGLQALTSRLPHHLSGGEKKKVALASVLAVNPDVLILDEPTNGLDPKTQRWLLETLAQFAGAGKTIVTATHYLDLVPELADRVAVMNGDHRLLGARPPAEVLADRELLLAADLIDERYHVHLHGSDKHVHVHRHRQAASDGGKGADDTE